MKFYIVPIEIILKTVFSNKCMKRNENKNEKS